MNNTSAIMWGVLFGSIGMGYVMYGRKQRRGVALLSGIILCAFPYFISNAYIMILIAIVLMALPYFVRY